MKIISDNIISRKSILLLTLILSGCLTSPDSRFYLLRSKAGDAANDDLDAPVMVIRSVKTADYLNRPQIVIRKNRHEVSHSQFDRWAEPLDKQISLYLTNKLGASVKNFRVKPFPWHADNSARCEVDISILSLDGTPGEEVELVANWSVRALGDEGGIIKSERSILSVATEEAGIAGIVAATEELLNKLSEAIASELNGCDYLLSKTPAGRRKAVERGG